MAIFFAVFFTSAYLAVQGVCGTLNQANTTTQVGGMVLVNEVALAISGTESVPYQKLSWTNASSYSIAYGYGSNTCSGSGHPHIFQIVPLKIRADSDINLILQANVTAVNPTACYTVVATMHVQTRPSLTTVLEKTVEILLTRRNYTCGGSSSGQFSAGTTTFTIHNESSTNRCLLANTASDSFSGSLDVMRLLNALVVAGYLKPQDMLIKVQRDFYVDGSGTISYSDTLQQNKYSQTSGGSLAVGGWTILNDIYSNSLTSDFSNITRAKGQTILNGTLADSKFVSSGDTLNAYQGIAVGLANITWVTPVGQYSLPFLVGTGKDDPNGSYSLMASLSFVVEASNGNAAACFSALLRNDYNSTLGTVTTNNSHPAAVVMVCPWSNLTNTQTGTLLANSTINGTAYGVYHNTYVHSNVTVPVYAFMHNQTGTPTSELDLMNFVRVAATYNTTFEGLWVTGVQAGFRLYTGTNKFIFQQFSLTAQFHPYLKPIPENNTNNANNTNNTNNTTADDVPNDFHEMNCAFSTYNSTTKVCVVNQQLFQSVQYIMSMPNAGVALSMFSLLRVIDDFTYYDYHIAQYNRGFRFFSGVFYNLTYGKWVPSFLDGISTFMDRLDSLTTMFPQPRQSPSQYSQKGESVDFYDATKQIWLISVPFSIITFLLFRAIYRKFHNYKLARILKPFAQISTLLISQLGENVQFLSFRCFSQFYLLQVGSGVLGYINLSFMYAVLFLVLLGTTMYIIFRWLNIKLQADPFKSSGLPTRRFVTMLLCIKFSCGWVQASSLPPAPKLAILAILQTAVLGFSITNRKLFAFRLLFTLLVMEYIFRLLVHAILFLDLGLGTDYPTEAVLSNCTIICMVVMLALSVLQILADFLNSLRQVIELSKKDAATAEMVKQQESMSAARYDYIKAHNLFSETVQEIVLPGKQPRRPRTNYEAEGFQQRPTMNVVFNVSDALRNTLRLRKAKFRPKRQP